MISSPAVASRPFSLSPEAAGFAAEQGVAAYLSPVLALTQRIFLGTRLAAYVEDDPDAADDRALIIEVDATALNAEQLVAARRRWVGEIFQVCPATHVCRFSLRTL